MSEQLSANAAVARDLRRVERAFAEQPWAQDPAFAAVRAAARKHARRELAGWERQQDGVAAAALLLAAELFAAGAAELAMRPDQAARLIARLQSDAGLQAMALAREVLRAPQLVALAPAQAVEVQLGLLLGFAPLRSASLWTLDPSGRLHCVHHAGAGAPSSAARRLAARLIANGRSDSGARAELFGLPLQRAQRTVAALVARCEPRSRERCRALLSAALPALGAILERDVLLVRNAASERALVEASERRLTRLGFDLHDGPLQELLLLGEDLRLFREQLGGLLGGRGEGELLRGRLDDLDARLVALEGGLRRISTSVHANVLISQPFASALGQLIEAFTARTGVEPRFTLEGDATTLSASQRIALLSVIGEALNNIREHSDAKQVRIGVSLNAAGVQAEVLDDGHGFDVEAALVGAARRGRIGLAGIHERVRLLGGQCVIESRAGGPTLVSLVLPRWEPLAGAVAAQTVDAHVKTAVQRGGARVA
jgi:signal transduction histidine kinase